LMRIPYTGSGVLSSAMVIDKLTTKKVLDYEKIKTPPYIGINFNGKMNMAEIKGTIKKSISYPVVVKPNSEGSTIGISIVKEESEIEKAIELAGKYDKKILIEKYIKGRELTVSIIGREPVALPIIEIKPKSGFYDYKSKYTINMTEYIVPAQLDKKITEEIKKIGISSHISLGCSNISRVDFILNANNIPYVLEVNTMPGMTPTSLVPKAAKAAGISFKHLVEIILNNASLKI
ncbi:MAG: D-alanine--D-alanine ligase, partial [Candidatus Humimicrobiaceae bacterium]